MDGARLGIVRAIDQALDAGMQQGPRTHGTRFDRNKQFALSQAMIADGGACLTQSDDFGMGGGVGIGDIAVPAPSDGASAADYDCADRNFAGFEGSRSSAQRFLHPELVGGLRWPLAAALR